MTNRHSCTISAGLMLLALAVPAAADPLAVVAAVKGRVQVVPAKGGAPVTANFGRPLERGDRLTVSPGGSATLFFNDGNVIELGEKSTLTVGGRVAARPRVGPGAVGLPGEVYANVTHFVTGGSAQTGLVAMSSMRGTPDQAPFLLAPRRTETLEDRPSFAWRAVEGATRYRLAVSGDAGELWNREVSGPSLDYPADAPALTPGGDFLWEVRALSDAGEMRREESFFHVLEAGDAETVRGNLVRIQESAGGAEAAASRFLAGSYLYGRGLYRDAASQFEALSRISPESSAPHEALGNVYRAVGLMDLAAAEYQRALALNREP